MRFVDYRQPWTRRGPRLAVVDTNGAALGPVPLLYLEGLETL